MEAAVVGVPDAEAEEHGAARAGESVAHSEVPRAYVVRMAGAAGARLTADHVKQFVRDRLAPYKQLRGGVVFVDELPKNALGKILRRELRERATVEIRGERLARL
jgi:acyl-coenzyme A synthetase/AMP-(fatty) acid ligase